MNLNLKFTKDMIYENEAPIIVGGFSGHGTRVAVWLLMACGVYMGWKEGFDYLHEPYDALYPALWQNSLGGKVVSHGGSKEQQEMLNGFKVGLDYHMAYRGDEKFWGWKNPGNMQLITYFQYMFPKIRYIHVVRDPRDTSDKWKKEDLRFFDKIIPEEIKELSMDEAYMWLWRQVTGNVGHTLRQAFAQENVLTVRLEDITRDPSEAAKLFSMWVGSDSYDLSKVPEIIVPETIGRHRDFSEDIDRKVMNIGYDILGQFGYIDSINYSDSLYEEENK